MLPATSNTLQQLENHENWQTIYRILAEAHPDRADIQAELSKLSNNKNTYVKQLQEQWADKPTPQYTEVDVRRLCSNYYSNRAENDIVDGLLGRTSCEMQPRDWIVRSEQNWLGWDALTSQYMELPIRFDGEIKFEKYYEQLVVSDKESGSCNLIWSIRKLIDKGGSACLSDSNWVALWLTFAKKYMTSAYPTLSRYSNDLETLFQTLISNINADEEVSKLRSSMSKLSRSPGMPLQVPLYRLKSYYELLVGINFPQMDPNTVTVRSEHYASNCTKYFVSKNTRVALESFTQMKMQKGEQTNVMSLCQVVGRHESDNPGDQIQSIMYLPEHATRLDCQLSTASNVEELFINSTKVDRYRGYEPSRNSNGSRENSKSPAGSAGSGNGKSKDGFKRNSRWTSPGGRNSNRGRSPSSGSRRMEGDGTRGSRASTPRTHSGRRRPQSRPFQSPGGRNYTRSPGRTTWRRYSKSPNSGRQNYTQNNRGRPATDSSSRSSTICIRCGGAHSSGDCRTYDYWEGPPCQRCGLMHDTRLHRARSTSASRTTQPGGRRIENYESEVLPGNFLPVDNQVNYFKKN